MVSVSGMETMLGVLVLLFGTISVHGGLLHRNGTFNETWVETEEAAGLQCVDGMILPAWYPLSGVATWEVAVRGIVYLLLLIYLFIGVSVVADKFMASIEMITSKKKLIEVKNEAGERQTVVVRVWNETVANLTLMALGCSAPEIMLSSIEVIGKNFEAGELGPGSTVGSAAFNLFVIIGVCILAVPGNESRKVKHVYVFLVTAIWSVFAYLWLLVILSWNSYGVVEVWEALVTFLFFPATVFSAYIADRYLIIYDFLSKRYRIGRNGVIVKMEGRNAEEVDIEHHTITSMKKFLEDNKMDKDPDFEEQRQAYIVLLKNLRLKHPDMTMMQLEHLAVKELLARGTQSRAMYRMQIAKRLTGRASIIRRIKGETVCRLPELFQGQPVPPSPVPTVSCTKVYFNPAHYTVMENVGKMQVHVAREGGDLSRDLLVDYKTEDGEAIADRDYEPATGTLAFTNGELVQAIEITIIDDDIYEADQHFYIRLFNLRAAKEDENSNVTTDAVAPTLATITPSVQHTTNEIQDPPRYSALEIAQKLEPPQYTAVPSPKLQGQVNAAFEIDAKAEEPEQKPAPSPAITVQVEDTEVVTRKHKKFQVTSVTWSEPLVPESSNLDAITLAPAELACVINPPCGNKLISPSLATVMILDDDHSGIFCFSDRRLCFTETVGSITVQVVRCGGARGRVMVPYHAEAGTAKPYRDYQPCKGELLFEDGENKKSIAIQIIEETSYEKDVSFYVVLGEPVRLKENTDTVTQETVMSFSKMTEDDHMALQSRPRLGDVSMMQVRLKESKEFKNSVDKLIRRANASVQVGVSSWKQQFLKALQVPTEEDEEYEDEEPKEPTKYDYFMHVLTIFWRLVFAVIPPEGLWGGYLCFVVSIAGIGLLTALIGDVANHLGCTVGLKDSVTAVAFVSLGTSLPDLFASKLSAQHDQYADASISNVLGSNAVNVFLGIGVAWSLAAIYHSSHGRLFYVNPGNLAFSVTLFCCIAFIGVGILLLRRHKAVGGELGGPAKYKYPTAIFFFLMWIMYIVISSLEAYGYIAGF